MAKRKKYEKVVLENIELKPQVIGYTYKKKNNLGRVIFIFIAFALVVYYINDISVFVNKLIGKNSAQSIQELAGNENNKEQENNNGNIEKNEIEFYEYSNSLTLTEENITLNNFNVLDNKLTFDIVNNSDKVIELAEENYFMELYNENKTLLERIKIDINTINIGSKVSFELDINSSFYYLAFEKKNIDDYPIVTLNNDENGIGIIKCTKGINEIIYTFSKDKLEKIKHTISDSNVSDVNYYTNYTAYQSKVTSYDNISGITATFNGSLNGYTAIIDVNLSQVDLNKINEKYYYTYNELPKVVKFEMQTYGFNCE